MLEFQMRFPIFSEYERLCRIVDNKNEAMHWDGNFSVILANVSPKRFEARGYASCLFGSGTSANPHYRGEHTGFRPAFICANHEEIPEDIKRGDVIVIGTLYVNGEPVRVPQEYDAETVHMVNDPISEMRLGPALDEPDYTIWGIYIERATFIADRPILRNMTIDEIEKNL